ncbi:MAG: hypothetical protein BGO31_01710 [Bacteroidetes bacterium 43-16]|nr:MAG: hypothetical protein BGO31_01710 [Bacteroidetes bacterium 43-16]
MKLGQNRKYSFSNIFPAFTDDQKNSKDPAQGAFIFSIVEQAFSLNQVFCTPRIYHYNYLRLHPIER